MFDWAAQPFYTLVVTFLFAPYFANVFIGDPVHGQALWGYGTALAGLTVALASPVLGAIADAGGRRKRWIAAFSLIFVAGLCGLWVAEPGAEARIALVIGAFVLASISAELATVFTNAMMPSLVGSNRLGRLSGIGWAAGYAGGLASLLLAAGFVVADPGTGRTMLGWTPLIAAEPTAHMGERLIGPLSALWYLVFVLPFFLFTPDHAPGPRAGIAPVREGLRRLAETARHARRYAMVLRFLIARMFYVDGLGAIFAFGGIYGAALFDWRAVELGLFGIILTIAGAVGALIGGPLDDRFGARPVLFVALGGVILAALGIVSVDKTQVLFVVETVPRAAGAPAFASTGEQVYLALGVVMGLVAGPLQSASRSFMARLAPKDMMTEFFGLFAFSGKITAFAAPLIVATVTALTASQRIGIATILLFLIAGFALLLTVRSNDAR